MPAPAPKIPKPPALQPIDSSRLESLLGYNLRRSWLVVREQFQESMSEFGLRPVDFSVLMLVADNGGITSRQLCAVLRLQPPNLVGLVGALESRGLLERQPHPQDRRALGLHATVKGRALLAQAHEVALANESAGHMHLSADEAATMFRLLRKIWQPRPTRRGR